MNTGQQLHQPSHHDRRRLRLVAVSTACALAIGVFLGSSAPLQGLVDRVTELEEKAEKMESEFANIDAKVKSLENSGLKIRKFSRVDGNNVWTDALKRPANAPFPRNYDINISAPGEILALWWLPNSVEGYGMGLPTLPKPRDGQIDQTGWKEGKATVEFDYEGPLLVRHTFYVLYRPSP